MKLNQTKALLFLLLILCSIKLKSQCFINKKISIGKPLNTTSVTKLDNFLITESVKLKEIFKIEVILYAYEDMDKPNAYASPICEGLNCDGSVQIGKTLLLKEIVNSNGYISVTGIMAHEYAHIVQFQQKSLLEGKFSELQADYLAGWYLGKAKNIDDKDLQTFAKSLYEKGDFDFYSIQHHGTPKERAEAMISGFQNSSLSLSEAYNSSLPIFSSVSSSTDNNNQSNSSSIREINRSYVFQATCLASEKSNNSIYKGYYEMGTVMYNSNSFLDQMGICLVNRNTSINVLQDDPNSDFLFVDLNGCRGYVIKSHFFHKSN